MWQKEPLHEVLFVWNRYTCYMTTAVYDEYLAVAVGIAKQARDIMRQYFYASDQGIQAKADNSPVTVADHQINQLVIDSITSRYAHHGVLGEEASVRPDAADVWVCDPIDSTRGFISGEVCSVFSLAYVHDGQPLVAVIMEPQQDRLYTAVKGGGAMVNGKSIAVSRRSIDKAWLPGPGSFPEVKKTLGYYEALSAKGAKIRMFGGNVFKGGLVAEGRMDGYAFPGLSAHDVAAVKLIVEEAGGRVTDLYGNEQSYSRPIRGAIVSNGIIHDDLLQAVEQFGTSNHLGY